MITFDVKAWGKVCEDFMGLTGLTSAQLLTRIAKGVTRRLLLATPPFAVKKKNLSSQKKGGFVSGKEQLRIGENAVKRDVSLMFPLAKNFPPIKDGSAIGNRLMSLIENGRYSDATKMAKQIGVLSPDYFSGFAPRINRQWHLERREMYIGNKNVSKRHKIKSRAWFIGDESARDAYIAKELMSVGKAKAGWNMAAKRLNVTVPAWVKRHSMPGVFQGIKDKYKPVIVVANAVDYVQYIATSRGNLIEGMEQHYKEMMQKEVAGYFKRCNESWINQMKLSARVKRDSSYTAMAVNGEDTSDADLLFWSK